MSLSPAQIRIYRGAWAPVARMMTAGGQSPEDIDEARMDIHEAVTGTRCSSTVLTNRQLDLVLEDFARISHKHTYTPSRQGDQPMKRSRFIIQKLADSMKLPLGYVQSLSQRLNHTPVELCDEIQLKKIISALTIHKNRHQS